MPHFRSFDDFGYHYHGNDSAAQPSDTFEFADKIGGKTEDPVEQSPPTNNAPTAPKSAMTGDSFFYADPPSSEDQDTPPTEMGDDFVI